MADFAEWSVACEQALGLCDGEFIAAYTGNIERANGLALEASVVAQAILAFLEDCGEWEGQAGGLLKALNGRLEAAGEQPKGKHGWPQTPRKLTANLKELAPNLRREGIEISWGGHTRKGSSITLGRKVGDQPSQPSHHHESNEISGLGRDGVRDGLDFSELPTVTPVIETITPANNGDGCDGNENANRHTDRHTLNHCKQKAGDGVTVVTVARQPTDLPSEGVPRPIEDVIHDLHNPTHRRRVTL